MRKRIVPIFVLICICLSGCKTSFIEDSKKVEVDINDYFSELEPSKSVSGGTSINDMYFSNEDESQIQEKSEIYDLYEGVNSLHIKTSCEITYDVLGWDKNTTARFYLFNKGNLIPFAINDSDEYNLYNDCDYVIEEEINVTIKFKSEDILAESGALTVMVRFNPEAEAGRGLQKYSAEIARSVGFTNQYYTGEEPKTIPEYTGEYLEIPITCVRNATGTLVADGDLYDENFVTKLYEGDVIIPDSTKDLYIYWNEGAGGYKHETVMLGIMVDGNLCKISGDSYFIKIKQNNGRLTFKYPLDFLTELDSGLHSITLISMYEDGTSRTTSRMAVIIP